MLDEQLSNPAAGPTEGSQGHGRGPRGFSFGMKAVAAAIALLAAMLTIMITVGSNGSEKNARETMMLKKAHAAAEAAKPPIDEALPARIETATFALG